MLYYVVFIFYIAKYAVILWKIRKYKYIAHHEN
jgi:hypothetical protein